jgi:hypothetical protein
LIVKAGLNLGDVDQFPNIDVTIDGADEVDVRAFLGLLFRRNLTHLGEKQDDLNAIKCASLP